MKSLFLMTCIACASPAMVLAADDAAQEAPMTAVTPATIGAQREAIVAAFQPGERFAELDTAGREKVVAGFHRMDELFGDAKSLNDLSAETKVELFNEQAKINAILTNAQEASREVCKRHRSVNSRLRNTECHTVAEWERRRERARALAEANKRYVVGDG